MLESSECYGRLPLPCIIMLVPNTLYIDSLWWDRLKKLVLFYLGITYLKIYTYYAIRLERPEAVVGEYPCYKFPENRLSLPQSTIVQSCCEWPTCWHCPNQSKRWKKSCGTNSPLQWSHDNKMPAVNMGFGNFPPQPKTFPDDICVSSFHVYRLSLTVSH